MSQFVVPNWNLRHQRQGQVDGGEGRRSSHVLNHPNLGCVVPMSKNHEVAELTWKNGHPSMHGLSNITPSPSPMNPTTCSRPSDHTLESIVHQATCQHKHNSLLKNTMQTQKTDRPSMMIRSLNTSTTTSGGKPPGKNAGQVQMLQEQDMVKKRLRSETESDQCGRFLSSSSRMHDLGTEISACASASATFCTENSKDTTMMTWASFESPGTLKTKTYDDDSASHGGLENRDEEQETKGRTVQTCSARRSRSAATHNQSERRRRDRINQKMKALQKLVPNASKTDRASMLDEVIEYLKQLQAQVHMMSTRAIPAQMMMMNINNPAALAMQQQQQQLQMSLLAAARLGMSAAGMGLGILDVNAMARAAATPHALQPLLHSAAPIAPTSPTFLPPPFAVPPTLPPSVNATANAPNSSGPLSHPYSAFLAQQTADMDFYRKMAALYRQAANQTITNPMLPSFNQGK